MSDFKQELDPESYLIHSVTSARPGLRSTQYSQIGITTVRGNIFDQSSPYPTTSDGYEGIMLENGVTSSGIMFVALSAGLTREIREDWIQQILRSARTNQQWSMPVSDRQFLGRAFGIGMITITGEYLPGAKHLRNFNYSVAPSSQENFLLRTIAVNSGTITFNRVMQVGKTSVNREATVFSGGQRTQPILASAFSIDVDQKQRDGYLGRMPAEKTTIGNSDFKQHLFVETIQKEGREMSALCLVRHHKSDLYI